ncbi:MAG: tetratricopeptide repeat protein [Planctomycetota bacterium]
MQIGPYRVQGELARGGMGVVYRALAPDGTAVALKLLLRVEERTQRRLEREVLALRRLEHPHVVRLLDAGVCPQGPWLALEFVEGETLEARLRRGPLRVEQARRIGVQLADALAHAHTLGILHRDLKPDNVLLRGDDALLTDFGLARHDDLDLSQLTASGAFLGTPGFWPPEQAQGATDQIGPWSDVYGLGAVLYACLSGRPPILAASLQEFLQTCRFRAIEPPSQIEPGVPRWLDDLCLRCLAPLPTARLRSAAEVRDALDRGGRARAPGPRPRSAAGSARAPRWKVPAAIGCALVASGLVWVLGAGPNPAETVGSTDRPVASAAPGPHPTLPPTPEVRRLVESAVAMSKSGGAIEALAQLDRALELDPRNALAWSNRGVAHGSLGRHTEAIEDYTRAIELDPGLVFAWINRGVAHGSLGRHTEAVEDFTRAIELDPRNALAWSNRGLAQGDLGHLAEALPDLERALQLAPRMASSWSNRGVARYRLGRYAEALEDYTHAIELDPSVGQAWANRAAALFALERYAEAIADHSRALELEPRNVISWVDRGTAKAQLERYAEAIEDYTRAIELDPSVGQTWVQRGWAKRKLGRHAEAARDYTRAIELDPRNALAWSNRGLARASLGRYEEAIDDVDHALQLDLSAEDRQGVEELKRRLVARRGRE